jgi:hypothetical protein
MSSWGFILSVAPTHPPTIDDDKMIAIATYEEPSETALVKFPRTSLASPTGHMIRFCKGSREAIAQRRGRNIDVRFAIKLRPEELLKRGGF